MILLQDGDVHLLVELPAVCRFDVCVGAGVLSKGMTRVYLLSYVVLSEALLVVFMLSFKFCIMYSKVYFTAVYFHPAL